MERLVTVEFGPSRSKRFGRAQAEAESGAGECAELELGRYRARFLLGGDAAAYTGLARLLERVSAGDDGRRRVTAAKGSYASRCGIPLQTQKWPETVIGQAMRYLAELAWAPQTTAANRDPEWREVNQRTVEVVCQVGSTTRWTRGITTWAGSPLAATLVG